MVKYRCGDEKMNNQDLTLLSKEQIWGSNRESQLEVIRKYETKAAITDLCVLTGSYLCEGTDYNIDEDSSLKGRTGWFWTRSYGNFNKVPLINLIGSMQDRFYDSCLRSVCIVIDSGTSGRLPKYNRIGAVRPVLQSSVIFSQISSNRVRGYNGIEEVEYGEYPQYAANPIMQRILEFKYNIGMNKTGRSYTFDSVKYNDYDIGFKPVTYLEYKYQGKKYIRIRANSCFDGKKFKLSNGVEYRDGDYVWVEVSPVRWLIDDRTGILVSKLGLVSGIRFLDRNHNYNGDFSRTEMKEYLDKYMMRDLFQTAIFTCDQDMTPEEEKQIEENNAKTGKKKKKVLK